MYEMYSLNLVMLGISHQKCIQAEAWSHSLKPCQVASVEKSSHLHQPEKQLSERSAAFSSGKPTLGRYRRVYRGPDQRQFHWETASHSQCRVLQIWQHFQVTCFILTRQTFAEKWMALCYSLAEQHKGWAIIAPAPPWSQPLLREMIRSFWNISNVKFLAIFMIWKGITFVYTGSCDHSEQSQQAKCLNRGYGQWAHCKRWGAARKEGAQGSHSYRWQCCDSVIITCLILRRWESIQCWGWSSLVAGETRGHCREQH